MSTTTTAVSKQVKQQSSAPPLEERLEESLANLTLTDEDIRALEDLFDSLMSDASKVWGLTCETVS